MSTHTRDAFDEPQAAVDEADRQGFRAFISYRREDAGTVARWLRNRLKRYRPPKELLKGLTSQQQQAFGRKRTFFLDTAYASANEDFWRKTIEPALRKSRFLIVVSSPGAFKSRPDGSQNWVAREISEFDKIHNDSGRMLLALAPGAPVDAFPGLMGDLSQRWDWADFRGYASPFRRWLELPRAAKLDDEFLKIVAAVFELRSDLLPLLRQEEAKRRLRIVGMAVVGLLVIATSLGGLAAWAISERGRANEQTVIARREAARAEQNFDAAKSTVDAVIFDLAQGLQHVEGMRVETVRRILERAEAAVGRLAAQTENDPRVRRSQAVMFDIFSETYLRLGATSLAAEYARRAADTLRELSSNEPANTQLIRDLVINLTKLGDVLRLQGDLGDALASYRQALDIARALAASAPDNLQWQRDAAVRLMQVGDVLHIQAEAAAALAAYQEAFDIFRGLAKREPNDTELQRDILLSLRSIGIVLRERGDLSAALDATRESVEITRKLVAKDPSNTQWRRDLAVGLHELADVLKAWSTVDTPLAYYREGLAILRELSKTDPGNTQLRIDVALSLTRIGDMLREKRDLAAALGAYRESLAIRRELVAKDPLNTDWQYELSLGLDRIGDVLAAQHNFADALAAFRESLDIRRQLVKRDPSNPQWQRELYVSLEGLADTLRLTDKKEGNHRHKDEILAAYRESLALRRQLAEGHPDVTLWQIDLVLGLWRLAGSGDDPRGRWSEALTILQRLDTQGRLAPEERQWIDEIKLRLSEIPAD
jgi:tetratricopeptide (TPR) repeat protein